MTPETEFTEFATAYLNDRKDDLRSIGYVTTIMNRFAVVFCKHQIGSIKRIDVRRYIKKRQSAGIADSTINLELGVLSSAIRYVAHRWEIDLPNPVTGQRLPATPYRVRYLTTMEALRLAEAAEDVHPVLRPFIELALNTGCRKTELLKTKWEDVDMTRGVLLLPAENTKTRRTRVIPLNQKAFVALDRLRCWQKQNGIQDAPWLFAKSNGHRLTRILVPFQKAREKAGIKDFTIHDLRHTFASWLVMSGVELIKVRDLLGHTTIAMTERYAHLATDRLFDAVSVLDRC